MTEQEALDNIRSTRIKLLLSQPFFGMISTRLKLIEETSDWNPTMATDGRHLYFNVDFVKQLTISELEFVIAHEILHCVFEHFMRAENRHRMLWNMATDYAINYILYRDKIGSMLKPWKDKNGKECKLLFDTKYKDMPAEQIYELLLKQNKDKLEQLASMDYHIYIDGDSDGGSGDGDDSNGNSAQVGDRISKSDNGEYNEKNNNGAGGDQENKGPPRISRSQAKELRDEFKNIIIDVMTNLNNSPNAGNTPAEVKRLVSEWLEPKIDWRELIRNTVESIAVSDMSFYRPSKKSWSNTIDAILPGFIPEETIKIACAIDVSGSISQKQINEFLSEIRGIMDQYKSFEIHLWSFDTKCNAYELFTQDNIDDLMSWEPKGGGGTHIAINWEFLDEKELDVDTMIIFTDLEDSSQNKVDQSRIDTIWVIENPYNKSIKPPFGAYAYYHDC